MLTPKQTWQLIKNSTWIALGVGCFVVAFIIWILQFKISAVEEVVPVEEEAQQSLRPVQAEKVSFSQALGGFATEVPAIDLSKRTVLQGNHEPEFRGAKFVSEQNKRWTLQIMKVTEEDIIRSYLAKRDDRKNFNYLRLSDGKNPEQFVLIYGLYQNVQQAMEASQKIDFELPDSIKILPEKISVYSALVNDLGSDELSSGVALRSVVLRKAALPKMVDLSIKSSEGNVPNLAGTTTTIQRKDERGEIKSTHVENSSVAPKSEEMKPNSEQKTAPAAKPTQTEPQVIDPF
ncbi:hypothetical protein GCM10023206_01220 [Acinetobacter puyangensis]|uniref:Uncharacterized protein n=1 Tax=Acinetobacter puyangensis TaxID=1096779 RepID=A0A240E6Y9_9GAMM|nr:hypothetical protein [Acinetobacter puyangensis]SNX44528.1 hypothetical protein SAMN05421731_103266 [Acinetobacter puyangensis]